MQIIMISIIKSVTSYDRRLFIFADIFFKAIGIKSNFAQPFFVHWDALLGTRMTREDIERRRKNKAE